MWLRRDRPLAWETKLFLCPAHLLYSFHVLKGPTFKERWSSYNIALFGIWKMAEAALEVEVHVVDAIIFRGPFLAADPSLGKNPAVTCD